MKVCRVCRVCRVGRCRVCRCRLDGPPGAFRFGEILVDALLEREARAVLLRAVLAEEGVELRVAMHLIRDELGVRVPRAPAVHLRNVHVERGVDCVYSRGVCPRLLERREGAVNAEPARVRALRRRGRDE